MKRVLSLLILSITLPMIATSFWGPPNSWIPLHPPSDKPTLKCYYMDLHDQTLNEHLQILEWLNTFCDTNQCKISYQQNRITYSWDNECSSHIAGWPRSAFVSIEPNIITFTRLTDYEKDDLRATTNLKLP